jgi:hypothetical protein
MSIIVETSAVTYYVHKKVLAISPILERVCETEKAKETASIALPDDGASIFERLLGYLYFQKFNPPIPAAGRSSGSGRPDQTKADGIIIATYIMARKYEVNELKPLLLESLKLRSSIQDLLDLAQLVYDAKADDQNFRIFFREQIMAKVVKAFDGFPSNSILDTLASQAVFGGQYSGDLTWGLAKHLFTKHELAQDDEMDERCESCGEIECQCGWEGCYDNKSAPSYRDSQCRTPGYCENIKTSSRKGESYVDVEEFQPESKANDLSKESDEQDEPSRRPAGG